jgi:hypothetical protein
MKSSYGYGIYRGKGRMPRVLKGLILVLAIILALLLISYFLLKPYMIYTEDGVVINLPFLHTTIENSAASTTEQPAQTQTAEQTSSTTAQTGAESGVTVVVDQPSTVSPSEGGVLRGMTLPLSAISDGTASDQLKSAGANAVIFDMKASDGTLGFSSSASLASSVSSSVSGINEAITEFNKGDYYTIARISCFQDDAVAGVNGKIAIASSTGSRWTDAQGLRWLNPYYSQSQAYVEKLCVELARLGFDEILLDHCAYPTDGSLDQIKLGKSYQSSVFGVLLDTFYGQVKKELSQYSVKVSLVTDAETLTSGQNSKSGQTAALLATYADRVYVAGDAGSIDTYASTLTTAGMSSASDKIVLLSDTAPTNSSHAWAVLGK